MKNTFNLHAHTTRCNHATGTEREYIERAIECGYRVFGFSDHCPMPFPQNGTSVYRSGHRMRLDQTEDYVNTVLALREEYKGQIEIPLGLEVEYYPHVFDAFMKFIEPFPFDYLILGQHFLYDEENAPASGMPTKDETILAQYVKQVVQAMDTGVFTYVAHPDVIRYEGDPAVYERYMRTLCEEAKKHDLPLEINGLGLKTNRHYPCDAFFRIAADVGNRVIYGVDAHEVAHIGSEAYEKGLALCERCGITLIPETPLIGPVARQD